MHLLIKERELLVNYLSHDLAIILVRFAFIIIIEHIIELLTFFNTFDKGFLSVA